MLPYQHKRLLPTRHQTNKIARKEIITVCIDGSCLQNGKKNATAGIGIFFGKDNKQNVSKKIVSSQQVTNNIAELVAMLEILRFIYEKSKIQKNYHYNIVSDSMYTIQCITKWIWKWKTNGWKTSCGSQIKNKTLIMKTNELYNKCKNMVSLYHVKAHTSKKNIYSVGNRHADKLAINAADIDTCDETCLNTIYI